MVWIGKAVLLMLKHQESPALDLDMPKVKVNLQAAIADVEGKH
jgi:hypothetical protein